MCLKKHPRLVSHDFFPLTLSPRDKSQLLKHHSAEGAVIRRWGDPEEGGWRWETPHQETRSPGNFSKLFQTRGSTILWVHEAGFRCRRAQLDLEVVGSRRGEQAPQGLAGWRTGILTGALARPPQLPQPHGSPALGHKPAQAPGM